MATAQSRYLIKNHKRVEPEDLSVLPDELKSRFWKTYRRVLAIDPYQTLPNHGLSGDLSGYRALEIDWAGIAYRLVYRVYESPAPRRILYLALMNIIQPMTRQKLGLVRSGS